MGEVTLSEGTRRLIIDSELMAENTERMLADVADFVDSFVECPPSRSEAERLKRSARAT